MERFIQLSQNTTIYSFTVSKRDWERLNFVK